MNPSDNMEEYLQFIEAFADTMASTFKQFAYICRDHLKKSQSNRSEFSEMRAQLIEQRKKRMELQDKMRQILNPNSQQQVPNPQERKRPKNAFALFVADQRDKILAEYPSLNFSRITSLAAIKWKKMSEQQRKIYQKKFQEMNKLYDQQLKMQRNKQLLDGQEQEPNQQNQPIYVKREDQEPDKEREDYQNEKNSSKHIENENQQAHETVNHQQEVGPTLMIPNQEENQATLPMQPERPVEPRPLENILNLFHTPASQCNPPQDIIQEQIESATGQVKPQQPRQANPHNPELQPHPVPEEEKGNEAAGQSQKEPQPIKAEVNIDFDPSIQIISQVVIDPTVQQEPQ